MPSEVGGIQWAFGGIPWQFGAILRMYAKYTKASTEGERLRDCARRGEIIRATHAFRFTATECR